MAKQSDIIYTIVKADLRNGRTKEEMEKIMQKAITQEKYEDCAGILRALKELY